MSTLTANAQSLRLVFFVGILGVMALLEVLSPKRPLRLGKASRWTRNLALVALDSLIVKLAVPLTVIAVAEHAEAHGIGLLNQSIWDGGPAGWGLAARTAIAVILLDGVIYLQHLMFHAVPLLWRLHLVHHADGDIDVSTGLRFHPIEILISVGIKMGAVYLLGAPALAVVLFEIILNGCAMFNHSNVALPASLDRILRWVLVTPDLHRVHHSTLVNETNSNFGFNLTWWDRLFGTYQAQPRRGHEQMEIGLEEFRGPEPSWFTWILLAPWKARAEKYAIHQATLSSRSSGQEPLR